MDISKIKKDMVVNAKNPGEAKGPTEVNIGVVEQVEGDRYVKLAKNTAPDGREHWFPVDWVESVDEEAIYLNQPADKVMAGLINEAPSGV
jgi:hypothetical protein